MVLCRCELHGPAFQGPAADAAGWASKWIFMASVRSPRGAIVCGFCVMFFRDAHYVDYGALYLQAPKGMTNLGNTCYLSSVCQALAAAPPFLRACHQQTHQQHCVAKSHSKCLGCSAEALVKRLHDSSCGSSVGAGRVDTALRRYFKPTWPAKQQQDAHEDLLAILDRWSMQVGVGRSWLLFDWVQLVPALLNRHQSVRASVQPLCLVCKACCCC